MSNPDGEHKEIWLEPAGAPDRCWCQDNQWGDEGVRYVLAPMSNPVSVGDDLVAELLEYAELCGDPTNEMLRDAAEYIREAASQLAAVTAERDAAVALNNKYAWERDKAREERDAAERRSEAHWSPRLEAATAQLKAAREALEQLVRCEYESAEPGLCDCIDNDGKRYQSMHLAHSIVAAERALNPKAPS